MTRNSERIVVLGVGNILLKDEGVGVRVVQELERRYSFPPHVRIVDGGTQGLWLLPTLQEADRLVVVDAVMGDGEPGTLYRLEKDDLPKGLRLKASAHDNNLVEALNLCELTDDAPETVVVVGIQPADTSPYGTELTPRVAEKIDELIERVLDELKSLGVDSEEKKV